MQTGCGGATSGSGPFYCPADQLVYIDLSFFDELRQQFGAEGGLFVNAYVIAHEYGHHVQNLLGTNQQVHPGRDRADQRHASGWSCRPTATPAPGPTTPRPCPTTPAQPLIAEITQDDIDRALDAAARIGDDFIQENLGNGTVDQDAFTHGSSEQRQQWFTHRLRDRRPRRQCDTFATDDLG